MSVEGISGIETYFEPETPARRSTHVISVWLACSGILEKSPTCRMYIYMAFHGPVDIVPNQSRIKVWWNPEVILHETNMDHAKTILKST